MAIKYRYKHKYDFSGSRYFSEMDDVFTRIFDESVKYYLAHPDGYDEQFALRKLVEYVQDLEIYLAGLVKEKYVTASNLEHVKNTFKEIKTVGLLSSYWKGRIYGVTAGDRIEINPNLGPSRSLTSEDRTLLYIGHEVGHRFHTKWTTRSNLDSFLKDKEIKELQLGLPKSKQSYVYYGLDLLSEALTQDMAENVVYGYKGRKRPPKMTYKSSIFNGEPYKSNFDFYGELQTPAVKFGRIIRGVGTSSTTTDDQILRDLATRAISPYFGKELEREFITDGCKLDYFQLLHFMGIIKDASYGMFGLNSFDDSLSQSKWALDELNKLSIKDEDYRERLGKN